MRRASDAGVIAVIGLAALTGCGGGDDASPASAVQVSASEGGVGGSSSTPGPGSSGQGPTTGGSTSASNASAPSKTTEPVPWDTGALPPVGSVKTAASGSAKLTILLDDGFGVRSIWTLTCDPAGGTHPEPATACGVLGAGGAKALPAPPPNTACTEQYGGPQKAKITGTWRGKTVNAELSLENGCQITRWTALLGLLPPGGINQ